MAGPTLASTWTNMHPPKPHFTEKDLPNLKGKVYIVTGANTGVGKELARMLYSKNAKVYIFARFEEKANKAIEDIKKAVPTSTGALIFMHLDLSDLTKIKYQLNVFSLQRASFMSSSITPALWITMQHLPRRLKATKSTWVSTA
jgi:retinol dehydrogenase-12